MPIPTIPKQLQRDGVRGFLGVDLRKDRIDMADGDVARAINADMHRRPGVAVLRLPITAQFSTSLGATIRRLAKHNGARFQMAGTVLYRNQVASITGLSANLFTTLQPFRHLNDTQEWVFMADDAQMSKIDESGTARNWGITAPSTAPTIVAGASTGLTGDYAARYSYARLVGSLVATESSLSPAPTAVSLANEDLSVTVVASADDQVTNILIYRTAAGGTSALFDSTVANTSGAYLTSQADSLLGSAGETDNDVPNSMSWVTAFQNHLFMCRDASNPHYLWWSKRFREEVPSANFLEIGNPSDPLQGAFSLAGFLGVFSRLTKYRVLGNATSGFAYQEALSSRGTPAVQAAIVMPRGVLFPARDGLFLTNFLEPDTEISQAIQPLFYERTVHDFAPIDWANPQRMALADYKGRIYFSYYDTDANQYTAVFSKETQRWYFFDYATDFQAFLVEEDVDDFVGGGSAGLVYILEDALATATSDVTMTVQPPARDGMVNGHRSVKKLYQYIVADHYDAGTGSITVQLFVDDVRVATKTLTSKRSKVLRLPDNLQGYTWHVDLSYTGREQVTMPDISLLYLPLELVG